MKIRLLPALALGCLGLALLVTVGQALSRDDDKKVAKVRVLLPDEEEVAVRIDGKTVSEDGPKERTYTLPELPKGQKEHTITAIWEPNNYTRFYRTQTVAPKAGETVDVDLRKANEKNPDKIEIRFVPTPNDVVDRMCKLGTVGKDDVVYDLGCGDGRMVIRAVANHGAKRGVGIDLDGDLVKESKENAKKQKVNDKVEFRKGDVLDVKDLSDASVVLLYMGDDVNLRLRPILQKTLKPGSRIVSHRFTMGDWKPDKTETFTGEDDEEYTIHLWTIKKMEKKEEK